VGRFFKAAWPRWKSGHKLIHVKLGNFVMTGLLAENLTLELPESAAQSE
jgi:hypothetical protein